MFNSKKAICTLKNNQQLIQLRSSGQYFMKNGRAIAIMPIRIIRNKFETKYENEHRKTPDRRAMPRRCFFPYTKYPIPIEPNNNPHINEAVLSII